MDWYEGREGKIPDRHRAKWPLDYRTRPLSESRQAFAHRCVAHAFKLGILERGNCLYCGAEAEAHHPDYNKPLWLVWLCADHHRIHHARLSAISVTVKQTGSPAQLDLFPARWFNWFSVLPPSAESIGHEGQYAPVAERLKKYEAALAAIVERRKT